MKKLLLELGTLVTITVPLVSAVACGDSSEKIWGRRLFPSITKNLNGVIEAHFDTAEQFNMGSLVESSPVKAGYQRNQFLFKVGTKAYEDLYESMTINGKLMTDEEIKNQLDNIKQIIIDFYAAPTNHLNKIDFHDTKDWTAMILGFFASRGSSKKDSILFAINDMSLESAKEIIGRVGEINRDNDILKAIYECI